jgi:hypothetical protein
VLAFGSHTGPGTSSSPGSNLRSAVTNLTACNLSHTFAPGAIVHNRQLALGSRLRGKRCRALPQDCRAETVGSSVRHPDSLVTCAPQHPSAVLSASTARTDGIIKVREYAAVPSIRRCIMESTRAGVSAPQRGNPGEAWRASTLTGDDLLRIATRPVTRSRSRSFTEA